MSKQIEVKISKSGHPVPVIGKVHLHSIYSPTKEAENFVLSNEKKIAASSSLLVFGLAFGYHLEAIEKRMKHHHGDSYEIVVIEPNAPTVEQWRSLRPTSFSTRVRVVHHDDINSFFEDRLLLNFLVKKPSIISHTSSFQLHETFYRNFMSFSYPSDTTSSSSFTKNEGLRDYLAGEEYQTTPSLVEDIESKDHLKKWDFFTLALNEINKGK